MSDDAEYRKSVRNMSIILAAIVLTIFAAIFLPPILAPAHEQFESSSTTASPFGFTLNLKTNSTSLNPGSAVLITSWLNSTSPQLTNVTAASEWPIGPAGLWIRPCVAGWPLGIGLMQGYYTSDNFTSGTLLRIPTPLSSCPVPAQGPSFFILKPFSTSALVVTGGSGVTMDLASTLTFRSGTAPSPGVYTVVAADEWGDAVLVHFVLH
ncbi:MAG: hypothetical protein JRN24_00400 [Nitrososphaerota archaeon]|nr:hypothetical protein [Nitrososphaerota archaeon]